MKILLLFQILAVVVNIESRSSKPGKSVNLALETVLEFDEKDFRADTQIINDVQNFLNKVKTALQKRAPSRRSYNEDDLKLTDFLENAIFVLISYKNNDLKEIFTALNDEMRKYHYKGCRFHELLESFSFRKFISKKLNELKNSSAKDLRKQLKICLDHLRAYEKDRKSKDSSFLNFVNSLYSAKDFSQNMTHLLEQIKTYNSPIEKSDINLTKIVQEVVRTILFDAYSNLNANVRKDVKNRIKAYWDYYIGYTNVNDSKRKSEELNEKTFSISDIITTSTTKATETSDIIPTKLSKIKINNNANKLKTLGLSRIDVGVQYNKHRPAIQALRSGSKLKPFKPVKLTTEAKRMQTLWVEERATTKKLLWDDDYEDETDDSQKDIKAKEGNEKHGVQSKVKKLNEYNKENSETKESGSDYSASYENKNSDNQDKEQETSASGDSDSALRTKKHKKSKKKHNKSHSKDKSASTNDSSEKVKKKKYHHKKSHKKSHKRSQKKKKGHKKRALRIGNTETTTTSTHDSIAVAHKIIKTKKVLNKIDNEKSELIKNDSKNVISEKSDEYSSSESREKHTHLVHKQRYKKSESIKDEKENNSPDNKSDNATDNNNDNSSSKSESEPETESENLNEKVKSVGEEKSIKGSNERADKSSESSNELEKVEDVNKANENESESEVSNETGDEESRKKIAEKQEHNNYGKKVNGVSTSEEGLSIERSDMRKSNKNDTFARKLNKTAEKLVSKRINALEKELETMKHRLKAANITADGKKARRFKIVNGPTTTTDKQIIGKTTNLLKETETNNSELISRETITTEKLFETSTIQKITTESTTKLLEKTLETTASTVDDKPHLRADSTNETIVKYDATEINITNDYSYEDYLLQNNTDPVDEVEKDILAGKGFEPSRSQPIIKDIGQSSDKSLINDSEKTTAQENMALNTTEDISELFTTGDPVTDVNGNNLDALLAAPNATMIIPFGKVTDPESDTFKKMGVGKRSKYLLDLENEPDLAAVLQSPFGNLA